MQLRGLLSTLYFCSFIGSLTFLLALEYGNPKWQLPTKHWRHIARNFLLFLCAVSVADGLVGAGFSSLIGHFLLQSHGLLTPFNFPIWGLILVSIVVLDLTAYGFHRLCHRWRWLWLIHAVHHSDHQLDASTSVRVHPAEMIIEMSLMACILVALGVPLWVMVLRGVYMNPLGLVQHANISYPNWVERIFRWLLVTPAIHQVHHSPNQHETNSNYGIMFSCWDRIFGTYRTPQALFVPGFGLDRLKEERWQTLRGMLLTPIKARGIQSM